MSQLHLQKEEKILSELKTYKFNKKKEIIIATIFIIILLILIAYLIVNSTKNKTTTHQEFLVKTYDKLNQSKKKTVPIDKSAKDIFKELSKRQREVLSLILESNYTYGEIAEKLHISHSTVKFHFKNIYAKFKVNSKDELLNLFREK